MKAYPTDPSLKASMRDGISHGVMLGAGESYLGPFGIFLQATTLQVGILATLPQLFGAVMQWASAISMDRFTSRRRIIMAGALSQGLTWLPIALLPFILGKGETAVWVLIGLALLYHGANGAVTPVWNSLIGDLVSSQVRGRFFGSRNQFCGMSTFIALIMAGGVLQLSSQGDRVAWGYLLIFLIALTARMNSVRWLAGYADPEFSLAPEQIFTFRQFVRRSPHSNFAKFVFFVGAINFGVAFSGPYFALYMLRDLDFSYLEFTLVTAMATIAQFLTFRYWGGLTDRFGTKKILNLCGWGIGIVPILWLASAHLVYLILIQAYAGVVWAGFSLSAANFLFDAVSPAKRARCVAYQGLINGGCVFAGSLAGGLAAGSLPQSFTFGPWTWSPISSLPVIFLLSGIVRFISASFFLRKFKEVRPVEPITHRELIFRVSQIRPIAGATFTFLTDYFRHPAAGKKSPSKTIDKNQSRG